MKVILSALFGLLLLSGVMFGAEKCSSERINSDPTGTWKGDDSYSFKLRKDVKGHVCVSIVEPNSRIVREVRDIVVINGELSHISYFTPSTASLVVYVNIKFDHDKMKFDWFSSFDLKQGTDTYVRERPKKINNRQ